MSYLVTSFSKIKLRTKIGTPVFSVELDGREIVLSNFEKILYVKDLDGNMLSFLPGSDSVISNSKTWSSQKITSYITDVINETFDIIDGGTF